MVLFFWYVKTQFNFNILTIDNDPCMSQPCLNNGVCKATSDNQDYECTCAAQFSGKSCESI